MVITPSFNSIFTSSFLTSGNSALIQYSFSVSLTFAVGVQAASLAPPRLRAKNGDYSLKNSSISRSGSHRIKLMTFPFLEFGPVLLANAGSFAPLESGSYPDNYLPRIGSPSLRATFHAPFLARNSLARRKLISRLAFSSQRRSLSDFKLPSKVMGFRAAAV